MACVFTTACSGPEPAVSLNPNVDVGCGWPQSLMLIVGGGVRLPYENEHLGVACMATRDGLLNTATFA